MKGIFWEGELADYYPGHIFGEVYKDKIYAPFLAGKKDLIILDIGGNIGLTTNYFADFAKQVYTVEPSKQHSSLIEKLVKFNDLSSKVTIIRAAISNHSGQMKLRHSQNKTMFSLTAAPLLAGDEKQDFETVRVMTLEELFDEQKIDHVDLLKLDVEGEEYNVICSESFRKVAPKINMIVGEIHSWANRNPDQLRTTLTDLGFSFGFMPSDASIFVASRII